MCLGIPGRVVELSPDQPVIGRVDVQGVIRDVNLAFLEDDPAQPGEWVLIHLGFALQKMTEAEVQDANAVMTELTDAASEAYAASVAGDPSHAARPA